MSYLPDEDCCDLCHEEYDLCECESNAAVVSVEGTSPTGEAGTNP